MWMGGAMNCLSLYISKIAFSILMEQKIHFINNIFFSEASQIITGCLNTQMKDYMGFFSNYI